MNRVAAGILLCLVTLFATVLLQRWVGVFTVYGDDVEAQRLELHAAILANQPPPGKTWESLGARNTNTRVAAVWLAEGLHRAIGIPVLKAYFIVDTTSLWLSLLLLYFLLREWFTPIYCLVGMLYFISLLPLTYLFYFFHPWDRMSQCLWVFMFLCIKREWFAGLALTLAASMVVKYDTVPVPAIYWLANVRRANIVPVTLRTVALLLLAVGILIGLVTLFPGGASTQPALGDLWTRAISNVETMDRMKLYYPPLLMHGLTVLLAFVGWYRADRVARAGVVVGLACLVPPWFVGSNFHEVRAQVPLTVLLLPSALAGLQIILERGGPGRALTADASFRGT
jgi:hypothetical protein